MFSVSVAYRVFTIEAWVLFSNVHGARTRHQGFNIGFDEGVLHIILELIQRRLQFSILIFSNPPESKEQQPTSHGSTVGGTGLVLVVCLVELFSILKVCKSVEEFFCDENGKLKQKCTMYYVKYCGITGST